MQLTQTDIREAIIYNKSGLFIYDEKKDAVVSSITTSYGATKTRVYCKVNDETIYDEVFYDYDDASLIAYNLYKEHAEGGKIC